MRTYSKEEIEEIKMILNNGEVLNSMTKAKKQAVQRKIEGMSVDRSRLCFTENGRKLEVLATCDDAEIYARISAFHLPNHHGFRVIYDLIKNIYVRNYKEHGKAVCLKM
ncbi:hypothetical protein ENBRE01_3421 [Enteropsectra breve]|nr:hypothetical protein ENBRE01_3421 [Enteropsectra breve]